MEDEELLNFILEKLYEVRFTGGILSINGILTENEVYFRKNQLNRVMADIRSNDFALVSKVEDDYQAQLAAEGVAYCEEVLMLG